ncbi:MAG TPA: metallophosphoesterase [Syntrophales bacterium]|nr:metallophosphoesterase [Syntrophales bacterium]
MTFGMKYAVLRLIILALAMLSQIYIFVHIHRIIRSSHKSGRFKTLASLAVGTVIFSLFALNLYFLVIPVPWPDPSRAVQYMLFYPSAVWGIGSVFSALLLCLFQATGAVAKAAARTYRDLAGKEMPETVNEGRRHFLQAGLSGVAAAPLLLCGYSAVSTGRDCDVQKLTLPFGRSLRAVQLTDIHAGIYMNRKEIQYYTERVIALQPDLLLLTGDYISNSLSFLPDCLEEMARVQTRYGTFATLGNHEHWYGALTDIEAIFSRYDITLLHNTNRVIHTGHGPFAIAGIDDLRAGCPDLGAALHGLDQTIPKILLSHRPEIFPDAALMGIHLTLAGHYHGGQIKLHLPGGDFSLAHLRTLYPEGLFRINDSRLYVSRGIGTTFTPVRLNAPPEITMLHLKG